MNNRSVRVLFCVLCLSLFYSFSSFALDSELSGIWENKSRFIEFFSQNSMRIILKPYYGFVYEDTGIIDTEVTGKNGRYTLSLKRTGDRHREAIPVAIAENGLYLDFFRRIPVDITGDATATATDAIVGTEVGTAPIIAPAPTIASFPNTETLESNAPFVPLEGFWVQDGFASGIKLYASEPRDSFFCFLFYKGRYFRIRYWKTDARYRDKQAQFPVQTGSTAHIPKFLRIGDVLYTCITGTGIILRNYESGNLIQEPTSQSSGVGDVGRHFSVRFKPDNIVFAATDVFTAHPITLTLSQEGELLAFGEPWLIRSSITDLDAEITIHNGKRRPPRKPVFDYMELVFDWDEIERIRNNGKRSEGATD